MKGYYKLLLVVIFSLFSVELFAQLVAPIPLTGAQNTDEEFFKNQFDICVHEKETRKLINDKVLKCYVYTKNKRDSIQPNGLYPFTYSGTIEDSMFIEIHVPGYQIGRFTYYKDIHRRRTIHSLVYLAKEGYFPNELIFSKDWIEVSIGKEKKRYDIAKLRKSDGDDELEILCRIPGLEVTKTGIRIDGSDIEHIYLPHGRYCTLYKPKFFELIQKLRKIKKSMN
jgi:hypothetical protein